MQATSPAKTSVAQACRQEQDAESSDAVSVQPRPSYGSFESQEPAVDYTESLKIARQEREKNHRACRHQYEGYHATALRQLPPRAGSC